MNAKFLLIAILSVVLVTGCRTTSGPETSTRIFPSLPGAIGDFLSNPVNGVYSLSDTSSMSNRYFHQNILIVSEGVPYLSYSANGEVKNDGINLTRYLSILPSEEVFHGFNSQMREQQVKQILGEPAYEGFDYFPVLGLKSNDSKYVHYSWFTLSELNDFIFLNAELSYQNIADEWVLESLRWEKNSGREF